MTIQTRGHIYSVIREEEEEENNNKCRGGYSTRRLTQPDTTSRYIQVPIEDGHYLTMKTPTGLPMLSLPIQPPQPVIPDYSAPPPPPPSPLSYTQQSFYAPTPTTGSISSGSKYRSRVLLLKMTSQNHRSSNHHIFWKCFLVAFVLPINIAGIASSLIVIGDVWFSNTSNTFTTNDSVVEGGAPFIVPRFYETMKISEYCNSHLRL